jgi:hypothetical protein
MLISNADTFKIRQAVLSRCYERKYLAKTALVSAKKLAPVVTQATCGSVEPLREKRMRNLSDLLSIDRCEGRNLTVLNARSCCNKIFRYHALKMRKKPTYPA